MKTRVLHTKFWNDGYVSQLNHKEKLFFLYLFTNDKVSLSGIYELPDKNIKADLDLTQKELDVLKDKLQKDGKFMFFEGWIKIIHVDRYNNYSGEKNYKAKQKELSEAPKELKDTSMDTSIDTSILGFKKSKDTLSNQKSVINESKKYIQNIQDNNINNNKDTKDEFIEFMGTFNKLFKRTFMSTPARIEKFKLRRKVFSQEQMLKAVSNMSKTPFFMGENDRRWKADPDYFLRSDEIVDKHLNASVDEHPGWTDEEWAILKAPLPPGAKEWLETGKDTPETKKLMQERGY